MFDTLKVLKRTRLGKSVLATAGAAGLLLGTAMSAGAWEINFEDFGDPLTYYGYQLGWIIDNEYSNSPGANKATGAPSVIPDSGGITADFTVYRKDAYNQYGTGYGVLYDTTQVSGGDTDLIAPFTSPNDDNVGDISPGHILIVHENNSWCNNSAYLGKCKDPDDNATGGKIVIEFSEKIWLDSIDFFDIEPGEAGGSIKLYSNNMLLPDTFYTPNTGGDNKWAQVDFDGIGVDKIEIKMLGSGGIDNIRGHLGMNGGGGAIPEPGSVGLMAAGMVAFGVIRRRRNRKNG